MDCFAFRYLEDNLEAKTLLTFYFMLLNSLEEMEKKTQTMSLYMIKLNLIIILILKSY